MPLPSPQIDDRRYQQLLDETLARVPVHTPEWTNFQESDPAVTVLEAFAHIAEALLYRANQVPDRNRARFLDLLGIGLRPASAAQGLAVIRNDKGPLQAVTLPTGLELRAGEVPFRTETGLDVLPVEARVFGKRAVQASPELLEYYRLLYASYGQPMPAQPQLYETVPLDEKADTAVDLGRDVVDRSLWLGLFARKQDVREDDPGRSLDEVRRLLAHRILTLGIVPALDESTARLAPAGNANLQDAPALVYERPEVAADGKVPLDASGHPAPRYARLTAAGGAELLARPGVVQLPLPDAGALTTWRDLDPLESGVGDLPPSIEDSKLAARLLTWIRIRCTVASPARILWAGANAVPVTQRARVRGEALADGDGQPDQSRRLSKAPVLGETVVVEVTAGGRTDAWHPVEDLFLAGPEVATQDAARPPGAPPPVTAPAEVFAVDAESGELRFGDGFRGRRPPLESRVRASYDYSVGAAGNVSRGAIDTAPALPSGFAVTNPVRTWGGTDAERPAEGEKQVRRHLQHRDRLVTAEDFESIAYRAPGLDVGRVEVLPAFHPVLSPNEPGGAPGIVTLMVIPGHDPEHPDAPVPDRLFLDALCRWLEPRRLITTELVLSGPRYKPLWISIGIDVVAGRSIAEVTEAVKRHVRGLLAPVRAHGLPESTTVLAAPLQAQASRGWRLRTAVTSRVLLAEVARVSGVSSVSEVLLAEGDRAPVPAIEMRGLELPRVVGISVAIGEPEPIDALRGKGTPGGEPPPRRVLPVPFVPEEC